MFAHLPHNIYIYIRIIEILVSAHSNIAFLLFALYFVHSTTIKDHSTLYVNNKSEYL